MRIPASRTQRRFLWGVLSEESPFPVVGFGGARGGGKTYCSVLAGVLTCLQYDRVKVLLLRRGLRSAINNFRDEVVKIGDTLGVPAGPKKPIQWLTKDAIFRFPNGSELQLGYCESERDYLQYQGIEYARIGFEELTQHSETAWDSIGGSLRPNNPKCRARRWGTCNPGGPGHEWVRSRFVDDKTRYAGHLWIPSTIYDCPATLLNAPNYVAEQLDPLPEWQRRQWKDGDWDAIAGQFWEIPPEVIRDERVPRDAHWYAGVDHGTAAPFAVVFFAHWMEYSDWTFDAEGALQWQGRSKVHIAGEVYLPGLTLNEQAKKALEKQADLGIPDNRVVYWADPAVEAEREHTTTEIGATIAEVWAHCGFVVMPSRSRARVPGWQLIKQLIKDGTMSISPKCANLLREMRTHMYEGAPGPATSEDLQQGPRVMDHAADALRYGIISVFDFGFGAPDVDAYRAYAAQREN